MSLDVSLINSYKYAIDSANLTENIKLVMDKAAQKNQTTAETVFEQNLAGTNSALLFEYTQSIAKSNIAQQVVLDNNLKETLKFLKSEAAKRFTTISKRKSSDIVEEILTDNDVNDFKSDEQHKEEDDIDNLELFDIKIDMSKNIFAA